MKRFNEEIIYVKTTQRLTKAKVVMGKRRGICDGCTYLRVNTSCPIRKYGNCCDDSQIFKLYE